MKYPTYPELKPSGIPWLGDVPEHWEVKRLSSICRFQPGKAHEPYIDDSGEFICVTSRFVSTNGESRKLCSVNLSPAQRNDILMVMSDLPNGRALAKAYFVKDDGPYAVNQRVCILSPLTGNPRFLYYLLNRNHTFLKHDDGMNQTHLSNDIFTKFPALTPPLSEQVAIASLLDRETAKIDALVAKKRQLIAALQAKRTALISETVTRGLPPQAAREAGFTENPPLKPSGIQWLGDVPEHWQVVKTTHGFGLIGSGTTPSTDIAEYYEGDVPWVTTSELRETIITDTYDHVSSKALKDLSALKTYPAGSLMIAMYGATVGRLGILGIAATCNQACCVFAQPISFHTKFVFYWLLMRKPILISIATGGGQPNLSQDDLRSLRIPAPEISEQIAITEFLDRETAKIDALVAKVEAAIEKLQQYRNALISSAVTGKIDVRSAV